MPCHDTKSMNKKHGNKNSNLENSLVSIGLCVYNGDAYLREAIDSLLAQTYKNFEFIISDNASADDTQKICEEYAKKDKRIRYIRQAKNIGSFGNYDFVRRESRGDYFLYASNDDLWTPRFIEKCLEKFKEHPDAVVIFPNFYTFDDSGRVMKYFPEQYFPFDQNLYKRLKAYLLSRSQYGKSSIIYGLWKKNSPADRIKMDDVRGDMIYMFQALFAGYFAAVPETLFFKRQPVQSGLTRSPSSVNKSSLTRPSLSLLASLPDDFPYETVDEWIKTLKQSHNNCRSLIHAAKNFINSRLQSAKYTRLYSKCIFESPDLSSSQKIRLSLWNFYAYFKSLWYGYL